MGNTVQRNGFVRTTELAYNIATDLIANGFTLKFPATMPAAPVEGTPYVGSKIILEAGATVDPLSATQPWRICIDSDTNNQQLDIYVGTALQLPNSGVVAVLDSIDSASGSFPAGGLELVRSATVSANGHFIARNDTVRNLTAAQAANYPMSYHLSVAQHGVALVVWEDGSDVHEIPRQSWFAIQRPVNNVTGAALTTGRAPVVCLFGLMIDPDTGYTGGKGSVGKIIVREADVLKPTLAKPADIPSEDGAVMLNTHMQVAINENNRYIISFPNNLNTPRYAYTEEIDMIATTSADVISQFSDVNITVYGEAQARTYRALHANRGNNTGMRLLLLTKGAGIP